MQTNIYFNTFSMHFNFMNSHSAKAIALAKLAIGPAPHKWIRNFQVSEFESIFKF